MATVEAARAANTASQVLDQARALKLPLGDLVASRAWTTAARALGGDDMALEIAVFDRQGQLAGRRAMGKLS